ncbi:hypothetical protein [Pseudomonas sp. M30-35]|uniref:hypothetical protein n=1 Tax=Pseudomonas sp. M30-35 TaxID=1981174 RepID=UPI000B3C4751|nr:hypothetical protein [Pseudomonas sp. M30-35]ARU87336.1 hypothetical protein B9K09_04775 [Pseudomonas sp. M30-35]
MTLEAICTLDTSGATSEVACPDKVYYDGCSFRRDTSKDSTKCYWDLTSPEKTYRCNVDYLGGYGSVPPSPDPDAIVCNGEGVCKDPAGNETGINPWDSDTPSANCYMSDGREICRDPKDNECIKVGASGSCLANDMNCYYSGLTLQCVEGDKPQRNCTYFNGAYKCFDPKDPSKEIPADSPDHPDNGGNADGNENNDPKDPSAPGDDGSGEPDKQGKDDLATNKSVKDVEDAVSSLEAAVKDGLAETNNLLEEIKDGLVTDEYDNSGDGNDADAKAAGDAVGVELANAIETETASILEERDADAQSYLDSLPKDVEDWFGADGSKVGLTDVIDTIIPSATGCSDYTVSLKFKTYSANLVIPVCQLTRVKPLLEWVIWCITFIGLWKILYSSLRQDDVKASKGGF